MENGDITQWSDKQLISAVKNEGNSEAFSEVCRRYQNLFYQICHKYNSRLSNCGICPKDMLDEKDAIILHCINTFNPSKKTKLCSWIGNYARYLCLNSIAARKLIVPASNEELYGHIEDKQTHHNYFETHHNLEGSKDYIFNILSKIPDKRIKRVFKLRYSGRDRMIWQDVAKKMKTTSQTAMLLHKKGLTLLKDELKNYETLCDLV